jgi:hypothetical protein
MGRRHFKPEPFIHMLREAEIKLVAKRPTRFAASLGFPSRATIAGARNAAACRCRWPKSSRTWNVRMPPERAGRRTGAGQGNPRGSPEGKTLSPERRRQAVHHMQQQPTVSERRACRVLGKPRSNQRRRLIVRDDYDALTRAIVDPATEYGRYGYRRITALLRHQGWHVNHKLAGRIWHREGPKVLQQQPKRGRPWLNDGSCAGIAHSIGITSGPTTSSSTRRADPVHRAMKPLGERLQRALQRDV